MVAVVKDAEALRGLVAGMTEHAFEVDLGIADPPLVDYVTNLVLRFLRWDQLYRLRDTEGRRLEDVAEMMCEAERRQGNPRREIYRHIGDFTLFWTGMYPEAVERLRRPGTRDSLLDYTTQGKRSYLIAGDCPVEIDPQAETDSPPPEVLKRLAVEFELCSLGLHKVRREWECPAA